MIGPFRIEAFQEVAGWVVLGRDACNDLAMITNRINM